MSQAILSATEAQLQNAQAKITYLGEQTKPIATVVFHTSGHMPVMKDFARLHRTGELYANDTMPYTRTFTVTAREFSAIVESLAQLLANPTVAQGPDFVSFTILRKDNAGTEGQEFKIGSAAARNFHHRLLNGLRDDNELGRQTLRKQFAEMVPQ